MDRNMCTFIGGPRDGQSIKLAKRTDYYDVALYPPPPDASVNFSADSPVEVCETFEKFTYRRLQILRNTDVFVPASWNSEYGNDVYEHVINRLVRGYVGNNHE